jgi:glycerol-3-phosphate cytidylyltransferase
MRRPAVYTCGTFDLFHLGHLRVIENAAALGQTLIVGVSTDELVASYKGIQPTVPFHERLEIIRAVRGVDLAIPQTSRDKYEAWGKLGFDVWVVGDDWYGTDEYELYRKKLTDVGVSCVFLPYTDGVSSTGRRRTLGETVAIGQA